eukprot:comp12571_c0_seq1/m.7573 comp12571_c0_seq1/g.7573  ORF comp12571_c0_seq1/g.7573 comp12571_c0_seq1/m.7573 type:complete len:106 (-) comp12571_c0_seq1:561-878(-)
MATLVFFDFPFHVPMEVSPQIVGLADSITQEPGFMWKIWTEDLANKTAGGVYMFASEETARAYVEKHTSRVTAMGVPREAIYAKVLSVQKEASEITKATALITPQ